MSMCLKSQEDEGFDSDWANTMSPLWDKLREERIEEKNNLIGKDTLNMYEVYSGVRYSAIKEIFILMNKK